MGPPRPLAPGSPVSASTAWERSPMRPARISLGSRISTSISRRMPRPSHKRDSPPLPMPRTAIFRSPDKCTCAKWLRGTSPGFPGVAYSGERNCIISAGGLSGILNVLLATIEVGDEVIVTDPTYAGLINRVHLAGGVPKFVPFTFVPGGEWRLDRDALRHAAAGRRVTSDAVDVAFHALGRHVG